MLVSDYSLLLLEVLLTSPVNKMETVLAFAAILGAAYFVTIIGAAFVTALKKAPAPAVAIKSSQMVKIEYRRNH